MHTTIQHLVLSGGGPFFLRQLGCLQVLSESGVLVREEVRSVYGTSGGALAGLCWLLMEDWTVLSEYLIKRPWQHVFAVDADMWLSLYANKGLYSMATLAKCMEPLFRARQWSPELTLRELYEATHVDFHVFSVELNVHTLVDFSHRSHPDLSVMEAIYRSCSIPVLFQPSMTCSADTGETQCFMDGGILNNYPWQPCIASLPETSDGSEVLGICADVEQHNVPLRIDAQSSTLLDIVWTLLWRMVGAAVTNHHDTSVSPRRMRQIVCPSSYGWLTLAILWQAVCDAAWRRQLYLLGVQDATDYVRLHLSETAPTLDG